MIIVQSYGSDGVMVVILGYVGVYWELWMRGFILLKQQ
jgi:hypothetical protein